MHEVTHTCTLPETRTAFLHVKTHRPAHSETNASHSDRLSSRLVNQHVRLITFDVNKLFFVVNHSLGKSSQRFLYLTNNFHKGCLYLVWRIPKSCKCLFFSHSLTFEAFFFKPAWQNKSAPSVFRSIFVQPEQLHGGCWESSSQPKAARSVHAHQLCMPSSPPLPPCQSLPAVA